MTSILDQPTTPPRGGTAAHRGGDADGFAGAGFVQWLVAALLLGAAVVHFALAAPHFGEATALGAGFLLAGWAQVGLAVAVLLRPSRPVLTAVIVVSGACIIAWAMSRTVGLPFGADGGHSEDVTMVDGVTVVMEAATIALAAMLFSSAVRQYRANTPALVVTIGILGLASAIVASPEARDHGAHEHGDAAHVDATTTAAGHTHTATGDQELAGVDERAQRPVGERIDPHAHGTEAEAAPDQPLDPATRALLGEQLTAARAVALQYPTAASAMAAGYREIGGFGPGSGAHYVNGRLVGAGFDASRAARAPVRRYEPHVPDRRGHVLLDGRRIRGFRRPERPLAPAQPLLHARSDAPDPTGLRGHAGAVRGARRHLRGEHRLDGARVGRAGVGEPERGVLPREPEHRVC